MKKLFIWSLLVCAWLPSVAQFSEVKLAEELMLRLRFADAHPIWAELATTIPIEDPNFIIWSREAAQSAYRADWIDRAIDWNTRLLNTGLAEAGDWMRQLELLQLANQHNSMAGVLDSAMVAFPDHMGLLVWEFEAPLMLELLKDTSMYLVEALRPDSKAEEFAAFPYDSGLVYVSTAFNSGFLAQKDGWTGQNFTEISEIKDPDHPYQKFTWFEQIRNRDLFMDLGRTNTHDGPVAFDRDEDFAVLTRNQTTWDTLSKVMHSCLKMDLYWKRPDGWEPAPSWPWNDRKHSSGHGVFDLQDDLVFASDRPGGFGGSDIYRSKWKDGEWGEPVNLGPVVNSTGDEMFPFISETGALYFASNGWIGAGGLDIFMHDEGSSTRVRPGFPINTHADDFAFYFNETTGTGWMSSNRTESRDAIYEVTGPAMVTELEVELLACNGSPMAEAVVMVKDLAYGGLRTYQTDENGVCTVLGRIGREYSFSCAPLPGMENPPQIRYLVNDQKSQRVTIDLNYAIQSNRVTVVDEAEQPLPQVLLVFEEKNGRKHNYSTDGLGEFEWSQEGSEEYWLVRASLINYEEGYQEFDAPPAGCNLAVDKRIVLKSLRELDELIDLDLILYDLDKAFLRPKGKLELDKLVKYMRKNPEFKVELSSHTDCRNTPSYNIDLSQRRSESCVRYIIASGISGNRIIAMGYGETQLVNSCSDFNLCGCPALEVATDCDVCSEEEHEQNRRTDLRLLAD